MNHREPEQTSRNQNRPVGTRTDQKEAEWTRADERNRGQTRRDRGDQSRQQGTGRNLNELEETKTDQKEPEPVDLCPWNCWCPSKLWDTECDKRWYLLFCSILIFFKYKSNIQKNHSSILQDSGESRTRHDIRMYHLSTKLALVLEPVPFRILGTLVLSS